MKKMPFVLGAVIIVGIAYWLISPLWRNVALNEELPRAAPDASRALVKDNSRTMDAKTKEELERQTAAMKDKIMQKNDVMPAAQPMIISRAPMTASAHNVSGEALLVRAGKENFLRFENLKTINGPALYIYLSAGINADDFVDLGPIRATEGSVNYAIPAGTDLAKYRNALIWCRAFGVLFSYARL